NAGQQSVASPPSVTAVTAAAAAAARRPPAVTGGGAAGAGVEIAAGAPPEHRLGDESAEAALEVAELVRRVTAVPALRQVLAHVRQQGPAAPDRDVEQAVVEPAVRARCQFLMGRDTCLTESVPGLFESARGDVNVHAEESGGHGYGFRLHLDMPEQTARRSGQRPECPLGELAIFRSHRGGGAHPAPARGFLQ